MDTVVGAGMAQAGVLHLQNCRSLNWLQVGIWWGFGGIGEKLRKLISVQISVRKKLVRFTGDPCEAVLAVGFISSKIS